MDAAAAQGDGTGFCQVFQHFGDHFSGAADVAGDFFVGQL